MLRTTALAAVVLALFASCSREKPVPLLPRIEVEEDAAPAAAAAARPVLSGGAPSLRIAPEVPVRGTRVSLNAIGIDLDGARIEWLVGGDAIPGERSRALGTESLAKGDVVQARATLGEQVFLSNRVTLRNAPPEIRSVKIVPDPFRPGDSPGVDAAASDADGDEVVFEYAWEKNGVPAGAGSRMDGVLTRGDGFSVRITPFDGEARGRSLTLRREFRNYLPSVEGVVDARMAGDVYACRVVAADGDGDPLAYALKDGPSGMVVDAATGAIRWQVPAGTAGRIPVTVTVTDGQGGEASYAMFVTFREEPAR